MTGGHHRYVLLASEIILGALGLFVEIASVLDGDGISLLRLIGAIALGDNLPYDAHGANKIGMEVARRIVCARVEMR